MDLVTENARNGVLHEILFTDNLVLISKSTEDLQRKFSLRKAMLESKEMDANINKTKLMVSGTKEEISRSNIDPCNMSDNKVMANSIMSVI